MVGLLGDAEPLQDGHDHLWPDWNVQSVAEHDLSRRRRFRRLLLVLGLSSRPTHLETLVDACAM